MDEDKGGEPGTATTIVNIPEFAKLQKQVNQQRILIKMIDMAGFFIKAVFYSMIIVLITSFSTNNKEIPWIYPMAMVFILASEFIREMWK